MKVTVNLKDNGLATKILRFERSLDSFESVWPKVERRYNFAIREHFTSEGARGGTRWVPLSPRYAKWKAAHHPGKPIMQLSRRLLGSMAGRTADTSYHVTAKTWQKSTTVPYAARQNKTRPLVQMTDADEKAFTQIFDDYAREQLKRAGLI